jgi:ubiquinone/menaquinone biosynthesis C-methylase UbiE
METIMRLLERVYVPFMKRLFQRNRTKDFGYWDQRAAVYGKRAVLDLGHPHNEYEAVTQRQKELLFPLFQNEINGQEKKLLDFGCGPGRFSAALSELINCEVIAVDPVQRFLNLAPKSRGVSYHALGNGPLPLSDECMDVVWICLVLGGITDDCALAATAGELQRVLKSQGLIFLVENTEPRVNAEHWRYRGAEFYKSLFTLVDLHEIGSYEDLGETISILAGRKCSGRGGTPCNDCGTRSV